jgi:hypothetical protein
MFINKYVLKDVIISSIIHKLYIFFEKRKEFFFDNKNILNEWSFCGIYIDIISSTLGKKIILKNKD